MSDVLSLVSSLQLEVRHLSARVDDFERRGALDLDRVLSLKETAIAIGKSPTTLRHWVTDAQSFERMQLGALLRKDPTNHWVSSPRLIARWRQVSLRSLQEMAK